MRTYDIIYSDYCGIVICGRYPGAYTYLYLFNRNGFDRVPIIKTIIVYIMYRVRAAAASLRQVSPLQRFTKTRDNRDNHASVPDLYYYYYYRAVSVLCTVIYFIIVCIVLRPA